MNAWEELVCRCARRRREELGPLSDEAYSELVLAVRENPAAFVNTPSEQAYLMIARALDAYESNLAGDEMLDDDLYYSARTERLSALVSACAAASAFDQDCLDARLIEVLARDLDPDPLLERLMELDREIVGDKRLFEVVDSWDDVGSRPVMRLRAAIARTCLDGSRMRMAVRAATSVMDVDESDPLGMRFTAALALARLEDEQGFDDLDARFRRQGNPWNNLGRVLLLYKLDRMRAAQRALRGFDGLCPGGAYALLRPVYVDIYLPDRPEVASGSFEQCTLAVREAEPVIADVPDFIGWCQGQDWFADSARRFADKNDLDW